MKIEAERIETIDYRGWEIRLLLSASGAEIGGHAELWLNGDHKYRVVLTSGRSTEATARSALEAKAREFIDDWITRSHTGTTSFGELESE